MPRGNICLKGLLPEEAVFFKCRERRCCSQVVGTLAAGGASLGGSGQQGTPNRQAGVAPLWVGGRGGPPSAQAALAAGGGGGAVPPTWAPGTTFSNTEWKSRFGSSARGHLARGARGVQP